MKIKKELITREIAGETFLIPCGKTIYDSNGLFVLTEVGAFIWKILPDVETEEEIVAAVLEEYEAERQQVENDVEEFLEKLRGMEII